MGLSKFAISTSLLFIAVTYVSAQGFTIVGKANGIKDYSRLYLRTGNTERDIDSAIVLNGRFRFSGKIANKAEEAILHSATYSDYVFFWLENTSISIDATTGQFKKAIIKGSFTQGENNQLIASKLQITNQIDSLDKRLLAEKDTGICKSLIKRLSVLRTEEHKIDIEYVKNHPRSFVSANLLSVYASTWGKETAATLYKNFSPELKHTQYGVDINNFILLNKNIKEGDKFVDFEQINTLGNKIKLSDIKGKYILLDFWASWCGPCREENVSLLKTYALYKDKGFAVVGVSLDNNKESWLKAVKDDGLTWENVSDLKGDKNTAALIYGISGIPDNFLIDANGTIIARNLRGDKLNQKLHELLEK